MRPDISSPAQSSCLQRDVVEPCIRGGAELTATLSWRMLRTSPRPSTKSRPCFAALLKALLPLPNLPIAIRLRCRSRGDPQALAGGRRRLHLPGFPQLAQFNSSFFAEPPAKRSWPRHHPKPPPQPPPRQPSRAHQLARISNIPLQARSFPAGLGRVRRESDALRQRYEANRAKYGVLCIVDCCIPGGDTGVASRAWMLLCDYSYLSIAKAHHAPCWRPHFTRSSQVDGRGKPCPA